MGIFAENTVTGRALGALVAGLHFVFVHDIRTKAIALLFAIILWFYVSGEIITTTEREVPVRVELRSLPNLMVEPSVARISLALKGPKERIDKIEILNLDRPYVLTRGLAPSQDRGTIEGIPASNFYRLPSEIQLAEPSDPQTVTLRLVRMATRLFIPTVPLVGAPESGFRVQGIRFTPAWVKISGPKDVLDGLKHTITLGPIQLPDNEKARQDLERRVVSLPAELRAKGLTLDEKDLRATVLIVPELQTRKVTFEVNLLAPHEFLDRFRITKLDPRKVTIELKGAEGILEDMAKHGPGPHGAHAFVRYRDLAPHKPPGPYKPQIHFKLPEGVEMITATEGLQATVEFVERRKEKKP